MSVDTRAYEFARIWLSAGGWSNDIDTQKLAQLIQDLCEDFMADLAYEPGEEDRDA
jgi:hypothetical protein